MFKLFRDGPPRATWESLRFFHIHRLRLRCSPKNIIVRRKRIKIPRQKFPFNNQENSNYILIQRNLCAQSLMECKVYAIKEFFDRSENRSFKYSVSFQVLLNFTILSEFFFFFFLGSIYFLFNRCQSLLRKIFLKFRSEVVDQLF